MINRRRAIFAIGAAAFGRVDSFIPGKHRLLGIGRTQSIFNILGAEPVDTPDDHMKADLARLGAHVYSEEGIPMFLACENLAVAKSSPQPASSSALNRKVASAFHRYTVEWERIRPDAPATDVAKIVELLASRDFADGGTETSL